MAVSLYLAASEEYDRAAACAASKDTAIVVGWLLSNENDETEEYDPCFC
jgi:hypothetical protein